MRSGKLLFIFCILGMTWTCGIKVYAQNYTVAFVGKSDLRKANSFYKKKNYDEAIRLYTSYLSQKPHAINAQIALANSLKQLYRSNESEMWYRKVFTNNKHTIPDYCTLDYAEVLVMNGKISEANAQVKEYLIKNPKDDRALHLLNETSQYPSFYKDSIQYSIQSYPGNSVYSDYAPVYYKNDIVFCSSRPTDGIIKHVEATNDQPLSHLFVSSQSDTHIDQFSAFHHSSKHDGPITFWDHDTKAIFCSNTDELFENGKLALFYSTFSPEHKEWSKPTLLPFIDRQFSYGHPVYHEQSNTLYFVSNIPGGYGGTDIYRVPFKEGQWQTPENAGALINTSSNEMYPFLAQDNVLYFASNGHAGMGGLDLYASRSDSSGHSITNLGYPVNSAFDDFSLVVSDSLSSGLFASNRTGNDDIFTVKIYKIDLMLDITDQLNYKPLAKCLVKVLDNETGEVKYVLNTDKNGRAHCALIPGKSYSIKIYQTGYAMTSVTFVEPNKEETHAKKSISLSRTHQRYVKAKILHNASLVGNCEVKLMDYSSDSILSYKADSSGSFLCEINSDTTALLYVKKGDWRGYALFEKDIDSRESSGITYIHVILQDSIEQQLVNGSYQGAEETVLAPATLYFKNRITNALQTLQTKEDGTFSTLLDRYGVYDVYATEDLSKPILTVDAAAIGFLRIRTTH